MPSNVAHKKLFGGFVGDKALKIAVLSLLGVVVALLFAAWLTGTRSTQRGDYEGRIVDRWADTGGEAESYRPRLALVIESNDGRRFTVKVDPNVYESARVGMRIRRKSGQIVLIESPQNPINK